MRRVKSSSRHAAALTVPQVAALLGAADSGPHPIRDRALVELLFISGVRVSELTAANVADLDVSAGELTVEGKGGKIRQVPLDGGLCSRLASQLDQGRPILLANDGDRLNRHQVSRILARLQRSAQRSGVDMPRVTPHVIRATTATITALELGATVAQQILGHESLATTQGYATRALSGKQRAAVASTLRSELATAEAEHLG